MSFHRIMRWVVSLAYIGLARWSYVKAKCYELDSFKNRRKINLNRQPEDRATMILNRETAYSGAASEPWRNHAQPPTISIERLLIRPICHFMGRIHLTLR
jgi:hypothetical protein